MCIHSSDNRLSREKKITMMCMMKKLHKVKEQLETDQIKLNLHVTTYRYTL